jgi:hypothetical protein
MCLVSFEEVAIFQLKNSKESVIKYVSEGKFIDFNLNIVSYIHIILNTISIL